MHFSTVAVASSFLLALTSAAPLVARDEPNCPADQYYFGPGRCPTGYYGCVASADIYAACFNSEKPIPRVMNPRIDGSCSIDGNYFGSFISCGNAEGKTVYSGCAKPVSCEFWLKAAPAPAPSVVTPPTAPTKVETGKPASGTWSCAAGTEFVASGCASGFVGCTDNRPAVCAAGTVSYVNGSCPPGYNWLVCKGASGCSKSTAVCD